MSIKLKTAIFTVIMASLLLFLCVGATVTTTPTYAEAVSAEQTEGLENEPTAPDTEENEIIDEEETVPGIEELAEKFKAYLVYKFGDDYEYYYNQIIEKWGSIEGYLLAFGEKLPEEHQTGWDKFVSWLGEYAPVWAPVVALAIVIVVAIVGKKVFNGIVERIVNAKLNPIVKELNLQSNATTAIIHSQKALLGTSDKFAENVKELEKADKELNNG